MSSLEVDLGKLVAAWQLDARNLRIDGTPLELARADLIEKHVDSVEDILANHAWESR